MEREELIAALGVIEYAMNAGLNGKLVDVSLLRGTLTLLMALKERVEN